MKTTLFAVALVVALSLSAMAQHSRPAMSQHRAGSATGTTVFKNSAHPQVPALCNPCLFYAGDLNPFDPNAAGMSDENTLLITEGGGATYAAVIIPTGVTATVSGIVFNVQADAAFDPMTASYDVRTGITDGNGGTSIASGSGSIAVQATGRNFLGLSEYSLAVSLSAPLTLTPGEYWFNLQPQCLNTLDGSCSVFRQFVSNTTQQTNRLNGWWQPAHEMFLNGAFYGITFTNWCDSELGFNPYQCAGMSFGLIGTE